MPVKGVYGFSRETVIANVSNIESMEYRRMESLAIRSTGDVEAFFALFHCFLGNIFTLKEFQKKTNTGI